MERMNRAGTDGLVTVIAIDPGMTTGWSLMSVPLWVMRGGGRGDGRKGGGKILDNIERWSHGQIDCGATNDVSRRSGLVGEPLGTADGRGFERPEGYLHASDKAVGGLRGSGGRPDGGKNLTRGNGGRAGGLDGGANVGSGFAVAGEARGANDVVRMIEREAANLFDDLNGGGADGADGAGGRNSGLFVVLEDFIVRQGNMARHFLAPVRVSAAIDYGLWLNGWLAYRQGASEAKTTATDERLKKWGLYERDGGLVHARDADRHAITFLRKIKVKGLV